MRSAGRIAITALGVVAALVAVVTFRTVTYRAPGSSARADLPIAAAPAIDAGRAARHLGEAVRFRTVSNQRPEDMDAEEFGRFRDWLEKTYPAAHAAMKRETVAGGTLVYTWTGSDASRPPVILLAHHDVVPVTPGTEGGWRHPPFGGVLADGAVWGRGSVDDKGSLIALFEAVESLAIARFVPARTVILVSGQDEEAGGRGAAAAAEMLRSRGVRAEFVLDEGLAIVRDFPLLDRPVALIGIAEKGYATLRVTAPAPGGHSSAPPPHTGVEVLARAVLAITSHPFPMRFAGPAAEMVRTLAPSTALPVRIAVANEWLFAPLLVRRISATAAGAATLHTTIAPTMLRGSPKENVLPQDAAAWINYRIAPGHSSAAVLARAREATRGLGVEIDWERPPDEPSSVSSVGSQAYRTLAALASDDNGVPVAPGLVTATTDSRSFAGIAQDVYRFQPIVASVDEFRMIHGTDEHLTLENLRRMLAFYARLIATVAR
jgi:carboxypeptidase PM20D1